MGTNCNASYDAYSYANSPELYEGWCALGFNLFRLPMVWQHVQIGLSGQLNETTMQLVDAGVQQITHSWITMRTCGLGGLRGAVG